MAPAFDGDLTRADLEGDTPYNTYVHHGLPPGPICSPGLAALTAALRPAKVPYLYFVAKGGRPPPVLGDLCPARQGR